MKKAGIWLLILVVIVGAAFGGYWYGRQHASQGGQDTDKAADSGEPAVKPIAQVMTAPLQISEITEQITAYGTVVAQPSDVRVFSVPFESRVLTLLVTPGEKVDTGTELVRVESSPDAMMATPGSQECPRGRRERFRADATAIQRAPGHQH